MDTDQQNSRASRSIVAALVVFLLAVGLVVLQPVPAAACSCNQGTPTAPLDQLDAAFIGIPRAVVGHARSNSLDQAVVRFEVIEPIKGDFGDETFALVNDSYTSCGGPRLTPEGSQFNQIAGLQITADPVPQVHEFCSSTDPNYVREGVPGLDPPARGSPAVAVAAGEHRGTGLRLLNDNAEVVAYVAADGSENSPAMCSDGQTLVTLTEGPTVRWRDLQSFQITGETSLEGIPYELRELSIDRCVSRGMVLMQSSAEKWLVSPEGSVFEMTTTQNNSGTVSDDGTLFARWDNTFEFEVSSLVDPNTPPITVTVTNHRGGDLEISPDGQRFAFYRRKPPLTRVDMEVVIVDRSGVEQHVLLHESFGAVARLQWLDNVTLAAGATLVDLSVQPASIDALQGLIRPEHRGVRAMAHRQTTERDEWVIVDVENSTVTPFSPISTPFYGRLVALPAPLNPTADGLFPDPRPETPLPGSSLPRTYEEFTALIARDETIELNPTLRSFLPEIAAGLGALYTAWARRRRRVWLWQSQR